MKENLMTLSTEFSCLCINLSKALNNNHHFEYSKQLKRASSSVGANIREAQCAESKKDFIHKLSISLKECNESLYWLKIIIKCSLIEGQELKVAYNLCYKIIRMLRASINTCRINMENAN